MPAPEGIMTFYGDSLGSIPSGWSEVDFANEGRFIKGSNLEFSRQQTGSDLTNHSHLFPEHTHPDSHVHTASLASSNSNRVASGGSVTPAVGSTSAGHVHNTPAPTVLASPNTETGAASSTTVSTEDQGYPIHIVLAIIESDGTTNFPTSSIFLWKESNTLPSGTSAYTTGEGGRYIRSRSDSLSPGTQVAGSGSHVHSVSHGHASLASHVHGIQAGTSGAAVNSTSDGNSGGVSVGAAAHTHTWVAQDTPATTHNLSSSSTSSGASEVEPYFIKVRAFKLNSSTDVVPVGSIAIWAPPVIESTPREEPPNGWWEMEEMQEIYPRIYNTGVGETGGSFVGGMHTYNHGHSITSAAGHDISSVNFDQTQSAAVTISTTSSTSRPYAGLVTSLGHIVNFTGGSVSSVNLSFGGHSEPFNLRIMFIRWSIVNHTQSISGTMGAVSGAVTKTAWKILAGITGALTGVKTYSEVQKITLDGTLGALSSTVQLTISVTRDGALSTVGQLNTLQYKLVTGTLGAMSGVKTYIEVFLVDVTGTLGSITGGLGNFAIVKYLNKSLNPVGIIYIETAIKVLENITGGYMAMKENVSNKMITAGRRIVNRIKGGKVEKLDQ